MDSVGAKRWAATAAQQPLRAAHMMKASSFAGGWLLVLAVAGAEDGSTVCPVGGARDAAAAAPAAIAPQHTALAAERSRDCSSAERGTVTAMKFVAANVVKKRTIGRTQWGIRAFPDRRS